MTISSKDAIKKLKSEIKTLAEKEKILSLELKKDAVKTEKKLSSLKEKLEKEINEYHEAQFQMISEIYQFAPSTVKHAQDIHDHIINLCKEYPLFYAQLAKDGVLDATSKEKPVKPQMIVEEKKEKDNPEIVTEKSEVNQNSAPEKAVLSHPREEYVATPLAQENQISEDAQKDFVQEENKTTVNNETEDNQQIKTDIPAIKKQEGEQEAENTMVNNPEKNLVEDSKSASANESTKKDESETDQRVTSSEQQQGKGMGGGDSESASNTATLDQEPANLSVEKTESTQERPVNEEPATESKSPEDVPETTEMQPSGQEVDGAVAQKAALEIDNMKKAMSVKPTTTEELGTPTPQKAIISDAEENDLLDKVYEEAQKKIINREAVHSIESVLQNITPDDFEYANKLDRTKVQSEIKYASEDLKSEAKSVDDEYQDVIDGVIDHFEDILLNNAHTPDRLSGPSNDDFVTAIKEALVEINEEVDELTMDLLISACKTEFRIQAELIQSFVPSLQSGQSAVEIIEKLSQTNPERKVQIEYLVNEVANIISKQNQ